MTARKPKRYPYAMLLWQSVISPNHLDDMPQIRRILRKLVREAVMNATTGDLKYRQHEADAIAKMLVP